MSDLAGGARGGRAQPPVQHRPLFHRLERIWADRHAFSLERRQVVNKLATMLIAALAVPTLARAGEELPSQVHDLQRLVGDWKGGGSMTLPDGSAKVHATWSCKRTSAKYGVLCSFRVTGIPGVPVYEETDLLGYEPHTDTYHWYAVTNAGETHDHVAAHKPSEFVFEGTQAGKPLKEIIQLSFAADKVNGRAETFIGGASASVLTLELRKGGKP